MPQDETAGPNNSQSPPSSVYGILDSLLRSSPVWVRICAVFLLLMVVAYLAINRFSRSPTGNEVDSGTLVNPYPQSRGILARNAPGNDNSNPYNRDADQSVKDYELSFQWHSEHVEDSPEWVVVQKTDDRNFIQYKYYAKTDKCMWVLREVGGFPSSQWIKDPALKAYHPNRAAHLEMPNDKELIPRKPDQLALGINAALTHALNRLMPPAYASSAPAQDLLGPRAERVRAQGACLNPHPGQFRYWWGTPIDQCSSPMYRQFLVDGCTHFQLYNRCANAWDPAIHWTYCNPNHRW